MSMLRITWLYQYFFLFLWNFDVCWGHIRNRCRNDELPIVLLQRDHVTGNFTVVERFSEDDTIPPVGSYGNDRHLMATDYLPNYWESTTASLRSTVNSLRVKDFPGLSLDFHLEESPTRTLHVSDEHDVHTTLQISDEYGVNTTNGDLFYARECTCFSYDLYPGSTIYCPMVVNTCREVVNDHFGDSSEFIREHLRCENPRTNMQEAGYTTALYILMTFFAIFTLLLFSTHQGKSALSFLPAILSRGFWNEWQVRRLLRPSNREWGLRLIWIHLRVRREQMERQVLREYRRENRRRRRRGEAVEAPGTSTEQRHNDLENSNNTREVNGDDHMAEDGSGNNDPIDQATSLVLRTRIFQSGESNDMRSHAAKAENDDDYLGDGCTICMMRLIDGERVGSLACKHVFHVRCLKPWLQRCNICPLCKQDEVAEPQYEKNTDENDEPSVTRRTDSVEESSNELMEESQGSAPTSSDGG